MSQKTISINNVNQTTGEATITIQVAEGTNHLSGSGNVGVTAQFNPFQPGASSPQFNANNFYVLDNTGTRKYYFGQYGNAFYGVSDGSVTAVPGGTDPNTGLDLGQASGEVPYWELVDTDCRIGSTALNSSYGSSRSGQTLLDYANSFYSFFSDADKKAVKKAGVGIKTTDMKSGGTAILTDAYMWPISATQGYKSYPLCAALFNGKGSSVWLRSYYSSGYAWCIASSEGGIGSGTTMSYNLGVAPAFNLDLAKVLLGKTATKNSNIETITYVGTKISEDLKFSIDIGTLKASGFTIDNEGNYSGAVTTTINGGTNYISEIIYDSTGKSLYYGNLGAVTSASGKVELAVPDGIESGTYTAAIFEEEKCAAYKTDYACTPVYFTLTV